MNTIDTNKPTVCFLIDTSDSMASYARIMENSIGQVVDTCKRNMNILSACFSDTLEPTRILNHPPTIRAHGGTNLYGGIVGIIDDLGHRIGAGNRLLLAIITDGENNRQQYNANDVRQYVESAEDAMNWDLLFLGTNQNAYKVANTLGIKAGKALSFASSTDGFNLMMNTLAETINRWAGNANLRDEDFIPQDAINRQLALGARG